MPQDIRAVPVLKFDSTPEFEELLGRAQSEGLIIREVLENRLQLGDGVLISLQAVRNGASVAFQMAPFLFREARVCTAEFVGFDEGYLIVVLIPIEWLNPTQDFLSSRSRHQVIDDITSALTRFHVRARELCRTPPRDESDNYPANQAASPAPTDKQADTSQLDSAVEAVCGKVTEFSIFTPESKQRLTIQLPPPAVLERTAKTQSTVIHGTVTGRLDGLGIVVNARDLIHWSLLFADAIPNVGEMISVEVRKCAGAGILQQFDFLQWARPIDEPLK